MNRPSHLRCNKEVMIEEGFVGFVYSAEVMFIRLMLDYGTSFFLQTSDARNRFWCIFCTSCAGDAGSPRSCIHVLQPQPFSAPFSNFGSRREVL